jgi:hypothetical protein
MALPQKNEIDCENQDPCTTTRSQIRDRIHPPRATTISEDHLTTAAALERQVVIAFDRDGRVVNEWYGQGSIRVTA